MNSYLLIKISNQDILKVTMKLQNININIYKIYSIDNNVYVKIKFDDYEKIKKYLITYNISIYRYYGIKYIKNIINKYKIIIIGLIIAILFIILSSFFIVDINIIHEDEQIRNLISHELDKYGIKKYTFKKSYKELEKIKKQIKNNNLDKIDWLEISKVGMKYVIRVEERIITKKEKNDKYCNVISTKEGLIKKINVYNGEAKLSINDYVKKGDIIISGDITLNNNIVNKVCALGKIYAEVWYEVNIKIPLKYEENVYTNKKRKNIIIDYNDNNYKLFKNRLKDYESTKKKVFDLLGFKIYIETQNEIKKVPKIYSEKDAIKKALEKSLEKIKLKMNKDDKIITQKVLQKRINNSTMDIDIFIVTEQQIGKSIVIREDSVSDI